MGQGRKIQMFVSGGRAFQNHRFSMQFIVVLERDDVIWAVFYINQKYFIITAGQAH